MNQKTRIYAIEHVLHLIVHLNNGVITKKSAPSDTNLRNTIWNSKIPRGDRELEPQDVVCPKFKKMYTQQQAQNLGLKGWCMNTEKGTVQGTMEGDESAVQNMKVWLKKTGSPQSRIEKAEFSNEKQVKDFSHNEFKIRR